MDPAYTVLFLVTTVGCPSILHWMFERERRKRRARVALLSP